MSEPLKLLLVEDSEDDALLVLRALRKGGFTPTYERVETGAALQAALEQGDWEILIADHALPNFSAAEALALVQASPYDLPFIVVSGTIDEQLAVELMRSGACDYVMKDKLERLAVAVRREVREARVRNERRRFDLALHSLITGTVALTGSTFFNALVQQIAQTLEVRYVLINAVVDGHLHTLAHWGADPPQPRPISTLEDSPTALALRHGAFSYPQDLVARFPTNAYIKAWGAESYIGLALYASNQCAFGTLCILDTAPLRAPELIIDLLRLFAARAAAELERHQALQALEQWNKDLERIVAQRTEQLSAANHQLACANLELAHAARMKDEFLANMSHELRTPLNAILAFSETLQEGVAGPVNAQQISALRHIEVSGQHLLALINDVLDLAKVEAGRVELQFELFAINDLCRGSLQLVKEQALKKQQQVHLKLNDESAYLEADPRRLKQILVNLLSNAVKFTPNHGQISLEVEVLPEAQRVEFHVRDNGIGIDPAGLERLFKPFMQLDAALNRQHEGTGLGLALVHSLAQLHGGSITVESQVGLGSCFTLLLPYQPVSITHRSTATSETASSAPASALSKTLDGVKILLAEDNEINLNVVSNYLNAHGGHVAVAQTGRQALRQAAASQPDIILMDIQMPEIDGLSVIRLLRADAQFQQTPIIVLSALAMKGDRERCLAAGANAYMPKPLRMRSLVALIAELLGR